MVYVDAEEEAVYFCRDSIGRRSLLCSMDLSVDSSLSPPADSLCVQGSHFALCSVGIQESEEHVGVMFDVPPGNIYRLSGSDSGGGVLLVQKLSTNELPLADCSPADELSQRVNGGIGVTFRKVLFEAVKRRVLNGAVENGLAVLFSGGLDSLVLARLSDLLYPQGIPITLITVSFSSTSPDLLTASFGYEILSRLAGPGRFKWLVKECSTDDVPWNRIKKLVQPNDRVMDYNLGACFFAAAKGEGKLSGETP